MPEVAPVMYPGSFDCLTYGHISLIERCSNLFGSVLVAVLANPGKEPMFSIDERLDMICEATKDFANVQCESFSGLTVECARQRNIRLIIRGLRVVSDFESELQLALMNKRIAPEVETIFLPPGVGHEFVSSSLTKEIVQNGGDASSLVPAYVEQAMREKFGVVS